MKAEVSDQKSEIRDLVISLVGGAEIDDALLGPESFGATMS
jgi:hypothetical protein